MARQLTITLDDEMMARLEEEARQKDASLDEAVTGALQRALAPQKRFVVRAFDMGEPLIDLDCTARALDEQERLDNQ
jgi:hypothetical protein